MLEQDMREIEITLEDANKKIKLGEALERLTINPDFKAVFLDMYFREHIIDLAGLQSQLESLGSEQSAGQSAAVGKEIIAIGMCKQFLSTIYRNADAAIRTKEDTEEEVKQTQTEFVGE